MSYIVSANIVFEMLMIVKNLVTTEVIYVYYAAVGFCDGDRWIILRRHC